MGAKLEAFIKTGLPYVCNPAPGGSWTVTVTLGSWVSRNWSTDSIVAALLVEGVSSDAAKIAMRRALLSLRDVIAKVESTATARSAAPATGRGTEKRVRHRGSGCRWREESAKRVHTIPWEASGKG